MSHKKLADGFIMKGSIRLSGVNYRGGISPEVIRGEDPAKKMRLSHKRELAAKVGDADMTFFMNKEWNTMARVMAVADNLGHHPAVLPEVEHLRLMSGKAKDCLFAMADEHAVRRASKTSHPDCICMPVFGSSFVTVGNGNREFFPVLVIARTYGGNWYDLFSLEEVSNIHPAWIVPLVARN